MIGRSQELNTLVGLITQVAGSGRAVVVQGDAGIGKTALVEAAAERAVDAGYRELRCTGVQSETVVGFAGLHELLHPVLGLVDSLPARQRAALSTAFGLAEGPAPERLLINLAVLGLLEEVASTRRLLIVVEDLQWLDRSTVETLTFVARRLSNAPILLLISVRTGVDDLDIHEEPLSGLSVTRIPLVPLGPEEAGELLDALPVRLSAQARRRVLAEAGGNPLALKEFASSVSAPGDDTRLQPPGLLPTTRRLEQAFLGTAAMLPRASGRMLLLAATAHDAAVSELFAAGRMLGLAEADLDAVERAGLVSVAGDRLTFRHPLVRSAVYGAATTAERAEVHRALATVTADLSRAAWHRAAATYERDEEVAAALEHAAEAARQRGGQPEAVAALHRAAALSPEPVERARRLAAGAEIARRAGATAVAGELIDEAFPLATDAKVLVELATTRLLLSNTAGTPGPSPSDLIALARRLAGPDGEGHPEERVAVLWGAAIECFGKALPESERRAVEAELVAIDLGRWDPVQHMGLALLDPVGRAGEERPQLGRLATVMSEDLLGQQILALTAESLQDLSMAYRIWSSTADLARRTGFPNDECQALRGRANTGLMLGRLVPASDDAEHALRMFEEMGLPVSTAATAAVAARVWAWRGDLVRASTALARSRELSARAPLALVTADQAWAGGVIALAEQRYADAWAELSHVSVHPTTALWALGDLTEAAVRVGQTDAVAAAVDAAGEAAAAFGSEHLEMLVARSRALLSDGPAAGEHFQEAVAKGQAAGTPLELARTRLLYGGWLRRQRRSLPAREQLGEALHLLDTAGARPWAERAASELRAAGVAPVRAGGGPDPTGLLTPQELQVARLAARGLTNKEIADQLYLSHRTVGDHLYRIYPKLGITARGQLRDALAGAARRG
ncbi:AAA family ATPase [Promicromonospora sp. NPDC050249]|uniref:ATP-binding protein n=1 Tax=Promicromonospora sp. NPDC050249 TaxID=3154743 RepID=UPI00340A18AD